MLTLKFLKGEYMKKIIIAEKPFVGKTYADILNVHDIKDGYMESDEWIVTWSVGHLVEMSYPEAYGEYMKKWSLDTLPFLPEKYKYNIISNVRKQYNVVKSLYHRNDISTIFYAGDSAREGLYIQMLIRMMSGHTQGIEERVVWIDSQTKETVLNGIRDAKLLSTYLKKIDAGFTRAIDDYLLGINFTRIFSILYGAQINNEVGNTKYIPISVGRVMTCVLGMVVDRENEIKNFVPTEFFKIGNEIKVNDNVIKGEWKVTNKSRMLNSPKLYSDNGFLNKSDALAFMNSLPKEIRISKVDRTIEKKNAPLLFNLAELQSECSKRFKIRPSQTLEIAQSLYEKKLTTYPRTDARVLSTAIAKEIYKNLEKLEQNNQFGKYAEEILNNSWHEGISKKKYVDDSKVSDHYAIIPTGESSGLDKLNDVEKKVYELIVRRFLAIFYPVAEYAKISIEENADIETFFYSGKTLKTLGYLKVYGMDEVDDLSSIGNLDKLLKTGDTFSATYEIKEGKTQPPKRYTSGSMVLAMENAGQLIEDESLREQIKRCGIGTSATRDATIEKLIKLKYIGIDDKTQILTPAKMGYMVYDVVKKEMPTLLSPKVTASWEKGLEEIENGTITKQEYMEKFVNYIQSQMEKIKKLHKDDNIDANKFAPKPLDVNCPFCGSPVVATRYGYACQNYNKDTGCKFSIGEVCGKRLNDKQAIDLIRSGETEEIKGFKSKSGKTFNAKLKLDDDNKIAFEFTNNQNDGGGSKPSIICKCGKPIASSKWNYECSDCNIKIPKQLCGLLLSESVVKDLLSKGKTRQLSGFKSKSGKNFKAKLKLENGKVEFDF